MYRKIYLYVSIILVPSIIYAALGTKLPSRQATILRIVGRSFSSDVICNGTRPCCKSDNYRSINGCYQAKKMLRFADTQQNLFQPDDHNASKIPAILQPREKMQKQPNSIWTPPLRLYHKTSK